MLTQTNEMEKLYLSLLLKLTTLVATVAWGPGRDRRHALFTPTHVVTKQ